MKEPKLLTLLLRLDTTELNSFEDFLNSPFFGNREERFFELLKIFRKLTKNKIGLAQELSETIYEQMNVQMPLSKRTYDNVASRLNQKLKKFLVHYSLKAPAKKSKQYHFQLIEVLSQKHYDLFKIESEKLIHEIENQQQYPTNQDLYLLHQLYENLWFHPENPQFTLSAQPFEKSIFYLDNFFIQSKLFFYSEVQNRKNKLKENIPFYFYEAIEQHIQNNKLYEPTVLSSIYFKIGCLLKNNEDSLYDELKTQLTKDATLFPTSILLDLILFLIHYAQLQYNKGNFSFHKEGFELYQFLLKEELLPLNGLIRPSEFMSILYLAYDQKEANWAKKFYQDYKKQIPDSFLKEVMPFMDALNKSLSGDIANIPDLDFPPKTGEVLLYHPRFCVLYIKIGYENWDLSISEQHRRLIYFINAFSKWLSRNNKRIDSNLKIRCKNFCDYVKSISTINRKNIVMYGNDSNNTLKQLIENINAENQLVQKTWLIKILNDLLGTTPPPI